MHTLGFYGSPQLSEILFFVFLVALPHLLSFLLALFYKKFRLKKLWLGLWIVIFCAFVCCYFWAVNKFNDIDVDDLFSPALPFVTMWAYIFFFMACGFLAGLSMRKKSGIGCASPLL